MDIFGYKQSACHNLKGHIVILKMEMEIFIFITVILETKFLLYKLEKNL